MLRFCMDYSQIEQIKLRISPSYCDWTFSISAIFTTTILLHMPFEILFLIVIVFYFYENCGSFVSFKWTVQSSHEMASVAAMFKLNWYSISEKNEKNKNRFTCHPPRNDMTKGRKQPVLKCVPFKRVYINSHAHLILVRDMRLIR